MNAPSEREMRLIPRKNRARLGAGRVKGVSQRLMVPMGRRRPVHDAAIDDQSLSDALRVVVEELPANEITEFIDTVAGADDGLDPALWGASPSTAEAARAHLANLTAKFADRQAVLAQSITRAEAAQLLRISDQAVSDRLAAGDLVGLKDGRVWKLPAWQFDADTENGWLPGILDLRQHFPAGPVTLTAWVTAPNVDLDGHTPAARLATGDVDQVLRAAQANGPTAW